MTEQFPARGTPTVRLARLILDALAAGDTEMAATAARRLLDLGGKR